MLKKESGEGKEMGTRRGWWMALWMKMLAVRLEDSRLGGKTHTVEGDFSRLSSDLRVHAVMLMSIHIHAKQITKCSVSNHQ